MGEMENGNRRSGHYMESSDKGRNWLGMNRYRHGIRWAGFLFFFPYGMAFCFLVPAVAFHTTCNRAGKYTGIVRKLQLQRVVHACLAPI
jgi:hypothetical protein